jgi:hypothetical protein
MKMAEAYSQIERWLEITRKRIYQFACGQMQHFHCVDGNTTIKGLEREILQLRRREMHHSFSQV